MVQNILPKEMTEYDSQEDNNMKTNDHSDDSLTPPWTSVSFACGGWLQFYMFGVAKALQASGLDCPSSVTYCGCSAGALAAVGLTLEGDFDSAIEFCKKECIPEAHGTVSGLFRLGNYVSECLDRHLIPNFKKIEEGKLQIAVTKLWPLLRAERVINHPSKTDLKLTLMASIAAIPCAPPVSINGKWYLDGGISDFQPIVDENTVTVSPFYFSDCDIKPSRYVPLWWCVIPPKSPETVDWLYSLGWEDCMAFIEKKGLDSEEIPKTSDKKNTGQKVNSDKVKAHLESYKNSHPYDIQRKVSVHRFLGYNLGNMTHDYVSFTMDFLLLVIFLLLLKPIALLLIYIELLIWTGLYAASFLVEPVMTLLGSLSKGKKPLEKAGDCFMCIFSLSLMLRFFSGRPSSATLRKHDRLAKLSILYRIFRHII